MLIFLRWLLKLSKKEQAALTRYERSHPHFLWFLALDALLSIALVVGGYQLFMTNSWSAESREPHGLSLMSSGALASEVGVGNIDAFWLGPVSGCKYTLNDQEVGIVDIFYLPETAATSDDNAYLYEVKTFASKAVWDAHTHPIKATVNTTKIPINNNVSIRINKSSMRGFIASFSDNPEIVAVWFPKPQSLDAMIKNAESLRLAR